MVPERHIEAEKVYAGDGGVWRVWQTAAIAPSLFRREIAPMRKLLLGAVLVAATAGTAGPALAWRECEPLEIDCHQVCTLPQFEKGRGVYWNQC